MWFYERLILMSGKSPFYNIEVMFPKERQQLREISAAFISTLAPLTKESVSIDSLTLPWDKQYLFHLLVVVGDLPKLQEMKNPKEYFYRKGEDHTSVLLKGKCPVHLAIQFKRLEVLRWMLDLDPDLAMIKTQDDKSLLYYAVQKKRL